MAKEEHSALLTDDERIEYWQGVAERALARNGRLHESHHALVEALNQCREYFDGRADADCEGDPLEFVPNREMRILAEIDAALRLAEPAP